MRRRELPDGSWEVGDGPLMVLLPGIRGDPAEFERLSTRLRGWRLRAVALPDDAGPSLAAIAARVLETLPAEPFHVVGASFGGLVGWALPATRVLGLVTLGTLPHPTPRSRRCAWASRAVRAAPDRVYDELYGPRARASMREDGADDDLLLRVRIPPRRTFADRLAAIARWGLPARPPRPATWMWGATDRFVTWDVHGVRATGMEPLVVPGGHRPHLSHPSEVARWLPRPP